MYHITLRVKMLFVNPIVYLYASLEANLSQASISRTSASTRRQKGTDDANTLADCRGDTMRLLGCNGAKPFEIYAIRLDKIGKLAPEPHARELYLRINRHWGAVPNKQ